MNDEHILKCLRVVAALQPGNKLCMRNGVFEIDARPNSMLRWFSGDSRQTTLSFISVIIKAALMSSDSTVHCALFAIEPGLENLKMTYMRDQTMCHAVDHLTNQIKRFQSE